MEELVCVRDFETLAKKKMSKIANQHCFDKATDGQTAQENCDAFKRYRFRPRMLRDVSTVDLSTVILGKRIPFPICVAPVGLLKLVDPGGEVALARAAASLGTGIAISTWTTTSMEDLAEEITESPKWFQVQFFKDKSFMKKTIQRAEKNSFDGIFLTIDQPNVGRRYETIRNKFSVPSDMSFPHAPQAAPSVNRDAKFVDDIMDPSAQWKDVSWLKGLTTLPLVLKGVLDGETAKKAVECGVDAIIVSNHGGRQLDGVPATIDVLREVVRAVDGRCDVYLDGGIRSGSDVLKAIAFGAKAVFVGRPVMWGLACNGTEGAKKILTLLMEEFKISMELMGFTSIKELQAEKNVVVPQSFFHNQ